MTALGSSQKGECRGENQDAILIRSWESSGLFIVSDGVGGSQNGSAASAALAENFSRWWEEAFRPNSSASFAELLDSLKRSLEALNYALWKEHGTGNCCATVVLLLIHQGAYGYLSAGDSRLYHSGRKGTRLLTRDDTWENLPGSEGGAHSGKLISAVGGRQHLDYSSATDQLRPRDCFLLCSDGIYKFIDDRRLTGLLHGVRRGLFLKERHLEAFLREAERNHSNDNYSLILVKT